MMPTNPDRSRDSAANAAKCNESFARRIARWKWVRLSVATAFAAIGIAVLFTPAPYGSVPLFICSGIAFLFCLDAVFQHKQVSARRWHSLTPRTRGDSPQSYDDSSAVTVVK
jgi:FtsH-binding integral membrane protein